MNVYLLKSLVGAFLFCLLSSAIYLLNDIVDQSSDRMHPEKRFRPIASGEISVAAAKWAASVLALVSLSASWFIEERFFLVVMLYAANNLLYFYFFKKKTVLDVLSIAIGFVLRVYGGGVIIGVEITKWLVACVFSLSVFLGFGKRRSEYQDLQAGAMQIRKVHESYSIEKLDMLLGTSAALAIVTYLLYSLAPETKALHDTDRIIFTTPFVVYCIFRYMLKVQEGKSGDTVELMLRDRGFLVAGILWIITLMSLLQF